MTAHLPRFKPPVWLSAKSIEYVEGEARERRADFDSIESFAHALWAALYDADATSEQASSGGILRELSETPSLVIVDDLDSVLDRDALARFLLFEIPRSRSKVIYTSRQRVPGLETIEVGGFGNRELEAFIRSRASEYELRAEECLSRLAAIRSVTDGFPLFVDDLLRPRDSLGSGRLSKTGVNGKATPHENMRSGVSCLPLARLPAGH